jgi:hypothetical protein
MPRRYIGEWGYSSNILDLDVRWELSVKLHAPAALPPGERTPGTNSIGECVEPRVSLDDVKKRNIWYRKKKSATTSSYRKYILSRKHNRENYYSLVITINYFSS